MTEEQLTATIRSAIHDALTNNPHICRFNDAEAAAVHQLGRGMTPDQLDAIRYLARWLTALGSRIGQALVVIFVGALLAGLAFVLGFRVPAGR